MKVVWSEEAVVALELRLAERYSADKAAEVVDEMVKRVDRLQDILSSVALFQNMATRNFASSSIGGTESFTVSAPTRSRS